MVLYSLLYHLVKDEYLWEQRKRRINKFLIIISKSITQHYLPDIAQHYSKATYYANKKASRSEKETSKTLA